MCGFLTFWTKLTGSNVFSIVAKCVRATATYFPETILNSSACRAPDISNVIYFH